MLLPQAGVSGVNFHDATCAAYSPILLPSVSEQLAGLRPSGQGCGQEGCGSIFFPGSWLLICSPSIPFLAAVRPATAPLSHGTGSRLPSDVREDRRCRCPFSQRPVLRDAAHPDDIEGAAQPGQGGRDPCHCIGCTEAACLPLPVCLVLVTGHGHTIMISCGCTYRASHSKAASAPMSKCMR